MAFTESTHAPAAEINVTPLVDIMLVLLIIFMVTAPNLTFSNTLSMPQPAPDHSQPPPHEPIRLRINEDGGFYWNGNAISAQQLDAELRGLAVLSEQEQPVLQLIIEHDVPYQSMVSVLSRAKNLGLQKLRLD